MSETPTVITIHNPSGLPTIDYRKVLPLQGDLKDLNDKNYAKLKNVLIKRGFRVPLFIWREVKRIDENIVTKNWLIDGHQRHRVMSTEDMQPYEVPYILVEAETEAEAKAMLLEISSQYGRVTQEGFDEFTAEMPEADLADLSFDALPEFMHVTNDTNDDNHKNDKHELVCPECGHVNVPSAFKQVNAGELSNV